MNNRPKSIYILSILWLSLSIIFVLWGSYSLSIILEVTQWKTLGTLVPLIFFAFLISTISWFVFSSIFIIIAYAIFRKDRWGWSSGIILSTIFLAIFALMLAAFMVSAVIFLDFFSIAGLVTVIISFIADLGIIFYLTRPATRVYLLQNSSEDNKNKKDLGSIL